MSTVSMYTNQYRGFIWKTAYAINLVGNAKQVSSQLFGCGKAKLLPLEREHLHPLKFVTTLLVWRVGHMGSDIKDWVSKPGKMAMEFELVNYQWMWCLRSLTNWTIRNTLHNMWQSDWGMKRGFSRICKRGRIIL